MPSMTAESEDSWRCRTCNKYTHWTIDQSSIKEIPIRDWPDRWGDRNEWCVKNGLTTIQMDSEAVFRGLEEFHNHLTEDRYRRGVKLSEFRDQLLDHHNQTNSTNEGDQRNPLIDFSGIIFTYGYFHKIVKWSYEKETYNIRREMCLYDIKTSSDDRDPVSQLLNKTHFQSLKAFGDDRARIFLSEDKCQLAIRGTDKTQVWLTNLYFIPTNVFDTDDEAWASIKAHGGMLNMFYRLNMNVFILPPKFFGVNDKGLGKSFFISGHSLGGALAQLVGLQLSRDYPNARVNVVTNGCPSIFCSNIQLPANLMVINFANRWDPVVFFTRLLFHSLGLTIWSENPFKWYEPHKMFTRNGHFNEFYAKESMEQDQVFYVLKGDRSTNRYVHVGVAMVVVMLIAMVAVMLIAIVLAVAYFIRGSKSDEF